MRNITRLAATSIAFAALAVGGTAATADAHGGAPTKVTIESGGDAVVSGYVQSKKSSCESNRKVTVFKKTNRGNKKVGSDIAQPNGPDGMWSVYTGQSGRFFAVIAPTKGCAGATSRVVSA